MAASGNQSAVGNRAVEILQNLIRFNTVNLPGNETPAAEYLVETLRAEGIEAEVLEGVPGRGNSLARLRTENPTRKPVLVMGHVDVVSVEEDKWSHDPFGGEIDQGFVWGRGTLDMKGQVAAETAAVIELHRSGAKLDRDIILVANSDEEVGTAGCGASYLWAEHRNKIDAEFAINEGGGYQLILGNKRFYTCSTAEKGSARLKLTARGEPGHASVPMPGSAMSQMVAALDRLFHYQPTLRLTATAARTLQTIASAVPGGDGLLAAIESGQYEALDSLPLDGDDRWEVIAMLTDTIAPTIIRGGYQINVIPSEVVADIDCRILPGTDPEAHRALVQWVVGGEVTVELRDNILALEADPRSPLVDAISDTLAELDPGGILTPLMLTGGTDAQHIPGIPTYGFFPWRNPEHQATYLGSIHGHDEKIAVDDLAFGAEFYVSLLRRLAVPA